jgi:hypothetical protein
MRALAAVLFFRLIIQLLPFLRIGVVLDAGGLTEVFLGFFIQQLVAGRRLHAGIVGIGVAGIAGFSAGKLSALRLSVIILIGIHDDAFREDALKFVPPSGSGLVAPTRFTGIHLQPPGKTWF